ncbi:MAG: hypothetical protein BGO21_05290 [Dyadobacter sp. 50-39]|uniref:hypothetical protein n=1 Tax=Dyadobacter sp. 50-39 TaxID=1895756 RepID=UPI000961CB71|nr:hypothetical protein [Dyadobacter sp. 50-39]OJV22571.1 MAG: hypothetical protein BGO21_05290 [Dyadobacter sp. 50-39]
MQAREKIFEILKRLSARYPQARMFYGKGKPFQHHVQIEPEALFSHPELRVELDELVNEFTRSFPDTGLLFSDQQAELGEVTASHVASKGTIRPHGLSSALLDQITAGLKTVWPAMEVIVPPIFCDEPDFLAAIFANISVPLVLMADQSRDGRYLAFDCMRSKDQDAVRALKTENYESNYQKSGLKSFQSFTIDLTRSAQQGRYLVQYYSGKDNSRSETEWLSVQALIKKMQLCAEQA